MTDWLRNVSTGRRRLGAALRTSVTTTAILAALGGVTATAMADDLPGVTATELKIGNTNAYSGPASAYGVIAKTESAFFQMVNDQGGVAGHKINFISYDDGYSPPKTVEQVRRLVEEDKVAFLFNTLGHADQHGDPALCEPEEGAASVDLDRRGQVGRLPAFPVDDGLPAQLPDGSADLHEIHAGAESQRQAGDPVSERRLR